MWLPRSPIRAVLWAGLTVGVLGCGAPQPVGPHRAQLPTKARLFGDPGLVPTRAGERARVELALAADLRDAATALGGVDEAEATVRLDQEGRVVGALLILRVTGAADPTEAARRAATQILGDAANSMAIETVSDPPPPPTPRLVWPLVGAVLGLGFSLGLSFDRGASRLARLVRRRRARRT